MNRPRTSTAGIATGIRLLAFLALATAPGTGSLAASLAPEILETGDPAWRDLQTLELAGALPAGATAMRPITR
ncbi:MAG: hypothetical protein GF346_11825, partial [Candidatus Eisenbacteria bacterium]|nr:hypothetical protein [Candidatus Latescibacterota bacterium]MBD3303125.1 hypothetical protein [Candidatus Eisenbacteria bacterium]